MKMDKRFYIGCVGNNAWKVSKVWRLGFHSFTDSMGTYRVIRLCFFRNKEHTFYAQFSWETRSQLTVRCADCVYYDDGFCGAKIEVLR